MKQSALYAYRRGESIEHIAHTLGFTYQQVHRVVAPRNETRVTTAIKSVKKRIIIKEETQLDRIERMLKQLLSKE